ncbi:MAG: zinc ribbon domain-containing protein [Deltaproteobacteria bacterium]|jgi:predicted amidophosphoribosyltransferase|nr:zinc ribbon domain-containing protein [Deltaproteobacteria bacterium]
MELTCQDCGSPIPSDTCPSCQKPAPLWAKFCPHCGKGLSRVESSTNPNSKAKKKRKLCSDESCIGIIGPDGVCTECGKRPF